MGRRLFVGNLNFKTTSEDLKELFGSAGTCEWATVMSDRLTGKSRGFGFVEMGSDEEAQKAVQDLNGQEFQGRNLNVNEARERTPGGGPGAGAGAPRGGYSGGGGGGYASGGGYGGGGGYQGGGGGGGYGGGGSRGGYGGGPPVDPYGGGGWNDPGGSDFGGGFGGGLGSGSGGKRHKEGGSRRGLRAKKRSL